jgi:4,5-dihydroxyphthalate decarboxylase
MPRLALSLAIGDYDHASDVLDGHVPVEGVELIVSRLPTEEIFHRFLLHHEWDIAEVSLGKYVAMRAAGDSAITALPVFLSRAFRHSMFYVREDAGLRSPADLAGRTIGVPEWAQTAGIYGRGWLCGTGKASGNVPLSAVRWVQAGLHQPGRAEKVALALPAGVELRVEPRRTLDQMLLDGEIDCVMSAAAPRSFLQPGAVRVVRLVPDYRAAEEAWYRETGIYPVMHALAVRSELLARHPWLAMNLYRAFDDARRRSMARLDDIGASHVPMPWLKDQCERMRELFGADWFPYGIAANRVTLEALCRFAHEQGLTGAPIRPEALFPATAGGEYRV